MALRAPNNKITFKIFQNFYRGVSNKFETNKSINKKIQDDEETARDDATDQEDLFKNLDNEQNFRYSVCQERTTPVERPTITNIVESKIRTTIEAQSLQPAVLPEFYSKSINASTSVRVSSQGTMSHEYPQKSVKLRSFETSKTQSNLTVPLKPVRLANPFPEPVKLMDSHKLADDEKAELMLNEAKQAKFSSTNFHQSVNDPQKRDYSTNNLLTHQERYYSDEVTPNPDKCKKLGQKKACMKITMPCCDPIPPERDCERPPKDPKCKKQLAPYPAYSEFCHEELIEKPSECKLCPWKPDEHPTFKPPKKHFHSSTTRLPLGLRLRNNTLDASGSTKGLMSSVSKSLHTIIGGTGLNVTKPREKSGKPVTLTVGLKASSSTRVLMSAVRKNLHTIMAKPPKVVNTKPVTLTVGLKASNSTKSLMNSLKKTAILPRMCSNLVNKKEPLKYEDLLKNNGMLCEYRKKPCTRPDVDTCEDRERREKERKQREKEKKKNVPCKKATSSTTTWTSLAQILMMKKQLIIDGKRNAENLNKRMGKEDVEMDSSSILFSSGCGKKNDKCKKFPFPHIPKKQEKHEECKKKKSRHSVDDCPGGSGGCATGNCGAPGSIPKAAPVNRPFQLNVTRAPSINVFRMDLGCGVGGGGGGCKGGKDKSKCPDVDFTCHEEEKDDPCNKKRRGVTKVCPGDLLAKNKRRKPKKKTSGVDDVPPAYL